MQVYFWIYHDAPADLDNDRVHHVHHVHDTPHRALLYVHGSDHVRAQIPGLLPHPLVADDDDDGDVDFAVLQLKKWH